MRKYLNTRACLIFGFIASFLLNCLGIQPIYAQDFILPMPGIMVPLSPAYNPPILKGIKIHPDNPFRFEFILDKGSSPLFYKEGTEGSSLKQESTKLIKYFMASLTIPEKDLWVNLSPYEKNRIVPEVFGQTEMGRDLLAEDYMLKQITASLIYPEGETGKKFWKRFYEEAVKKFGTTNIPVNTFNKVWIIPDKAVVYENASTSGAKAAVAYIVEAKLKVMLEQDYLSLSKHTLGTDLVSVCNNKERMDTRSIPTEILRKIVIPELTREVNEGKNFAQLRQVYNSLILATWYKKKIKDSILAQVYENKNKVVGVNIDDPKQTERIYERYVQAFKKGSYNYIKEEIDPVTQQSIPRKYISGGFDFGDDMDAAMAIANKLPDTAMDTTNDVIVDSAMTARNLGTKIVKGPDNVSSDGMGSVGNYDKAMSVQRSTPAMATGEAAKPNMDHILNSIRESPDLNSTLNIISTYHDDHAVLESIILHSKDEWAILLAIGILQNESNEGLLNQFIGKPINGDPNFMTNYLKLDRSLNYILEHTFGYSLLDIRKDYLDQVLEDSVDKRIDYLTEKFVRILNLSLKQEKQRELLQLLGKFILPQFEEIRHPLTTALKDIQDWLAYSIMGYHEEYIDRTKILSEIKGMPWASAMIFAANGPHTRFLFSPTDEDDIIANTHLINGFLGTFEDKIDSLAIKKRKNTSDLPKVENEVRGFAGALLNGLLIQSNLNEAQYLEMLNSALAGHLKLDRMINKALHVFQGKEMPAFLHFPDGFFGNEVIDDVAYRNSRNGEQVTARALFTGIPSVDADQYRQDLEARNRKNPEKGQTLEPISTTKAKYVWLQKRFLKEDAAMRASSDNFIENNQEIKLPPEIGSFAQAVRYVIEHKRWENIKVAARNLVENYTTLKLYLEERKTPRQKITVYRWAKKLNVNADVLLRISGFTVDPPKSLGEAIKDGMERQMWTLEMAAYKLGVTSLTLRRYIKDGSLSPEMIFKISTIFEMNPNALFKLAGIDLENPRTFQEAIMLARIKKGLTKKDAARLVGRTIDAVIRIETNGRNFREETLKSFIKAYGIKDAEIAKLYKLAGFDPAMHVNTVKNGGIDFTSDKSLTLQNNGHAIKFHISAGCGSAFGGDTNQLKQLENASGFVPVIISIEPMSNLKAFLISP